MSLFPSFNPPVNSLILDRVRTFVHVLALYFKNGTLVLGVLAVLVIDVVTGPMYLGGMNPDGSTRYAIMFWCIGFALTGIQLVVWENAGEFKRKYGNWMFCVPAAFGVLLMFCDLMLDIGFVTQLLNPDISNSTIIPETSAQNAIWWIMCTVVGIISLICEPLLLWMVSKRGDD